jgi:hypothetical protein
MIGVLMNKKFKISIIVLSLLLIVMSIGYASYAVTLYISGNVSLQASSWSVIFDNVKKGTVESGYKLVDATSEPSIFNDKHSITFSVDLNVGEMYQFTVDVKNAGTIKAYLDTYNIIIDGTTYNLNKWNNEYLSYDAVWTDDNSSFAQGDTLDAGGSRNVTVTVKYFQPEDSSDLPSKDETHTLTLNMNWIQGNYFTSGQSITTSAFEVYKYKDTVLNGADPVLATDMLPVTIANDGVVTYADTTKEWYNYTNKTWANAVKLIASPSKTYKTGDTISEADIETYLVWIPRYKYELWNVGVTDVTSSQVPKTIPITFESKDTTKSTGSTDGTYLTHPAFTFGSSELNGIWVSKFEVTGSTSAITSKPNVNSLRSTTVGNFWNALKSYDISDTSHMMKNTEWGAVAYLSASVYGKNSEVYINNDSNYITGCGGTTASASSTTTCTNAYASVTSYPQSTTGNISGIFDMSGGAWEYMAAYMSGQVGSSGLTVDTINANSNYFDIYNSSSTDTSYNYRILGDATGEMGPITSYHSPWYQDDAYFVSSSYPWFLRGGDFNSTGDAGVFGFGYNTGVANGNFGSRLVLAPEAS